MSCELHRAHHENTSTHRTCSFVKSWHRRAGTTSLNFFHAALRHMAKINRETLCVQPVDRLHTRVMCQSTKLTIELNCIGLITRKIDTMRLSKILQFEHNVEVEQGANRTGNKLKGQFRNIGCILTRLTFAPVQPKCFLRYCCNNSSHRVPR